MKIWSFSKYPIVSVRPLLQNSHVYMKSIPLPRNGVAWKLTTDQWHALLLSWQKHEASSSVTNSPWRGYQLTTGSPWQAYSIAIFFLSTHFISCLNVEQCSESNMSCRSRTWHSNPKHVSLATAWWLHSQKLVSQPVKRNKCPNFNWQYLQLLFVWWALLHQTGPEKELGWLIHVYHHDHIIAQWNQQNFNYNSKSIIYIIQLKAFKIFLGFLIQATCICSNISDSDDCIQSIITCRGMLLFSEHCLQN